MFRSKICFSILLLCLLLGCRSVQRASRTGFPDYITIEELDYGVVLVDQDEPGKSMITNQTDVIPCRTDVTFGIDYIIRTSTRKKKIAMSIRIIKPAFTNETMAVPKAVTNMTYIDQPNRKTHHSVTLNEAEDLITGQWQFVFLYQDKEVHRRSFQLVTVE